MSDGFDDRFAAMEKLLADETTDVRNLLQELDEEEKFVDEKNAELAQELAELTALRDMLRHDALGGGWRSDEFAELEALREQLSRRRQNEDTMDELELDNDDLDVEIEAMAARIHSVTHDVGALEASKRRLETELREWEQLEREERRKERGE
jgi:chromosome segregation ATPase